MEYHLDLAGLSVLLQTPEKITLSDRLTPFLSQPEEQPACTLQVRIVSSLPAPTEQGVWHGPEYYDRREASLRVFHCSTPGGTAFGMTQHDKTGNIQLLVLPEYAHYFSGSSGIFNRIGMETLLLQHQGLLLHASLIKYAGRAIAFAGPSGVGKSTQAALWQECLGARVINGDRAALRQRDGVWTGYGSPYAGTSGIYRKDSAPLAAVVLLRRHTENRLTRLTPAQALPKLYPELSMHRWDKEFTARATDLCLRLLEEVPVYLLECRPEPAAAQLLKKGLAL